MPSVAKPLSAARSGPKPDFTIAFVNSVRNVFSKMVKLATEIEKPREKTASEPSHDVSAIVGMSGDVTGSVVVCFNMAAAAKIVDAFAGFTVEPSSPEFADAIGELANMIAGNAKKDLGATVNITVPSVVIGPGHHVAQLKNASCMVLTCKTPAGDFQVEVSAKSRS